MSGFFLGSIPHLQLTSGFGLSLTRSLYQFCFSWMLTGHASSVLLPRTGYPSYGSALHNTHKILSNSIVSDPVREYEIYNVILQLKMPHLDETIYRYLLLKAAVVLF